MQRKEGTNTFLVKVYDTDEDNVRCNYAIVTLSEQLIDSLSKLRKVQEENDCYEITKFSTSCHFINEDEYDDDNTVDLDLIEQIEDFMDTDSGEGVCQIDGEIIDLNSIPKLRTDANLVHVSEFGVKFTAIGKWSDVRFVTEKISWEQIKM